MTVSASAVETQRNRTLAKPADAKPSAGKKSGAALRAYERRMARASLHGQTDASAGASGSRGIGAFDTSAITARIPFVALVIGLLSIGLGVTLLLTTRSAEDSYQLSDAKAHNLALSDQKSALQRDVKLADSAPELARKAALLGMIPANNVARIVVAADGTKQVIGTPAPATGVPAPLLNVDPSAPVTSATSVTSVSAVPVSRIGVPVAGVTASAPVSATPGVVNRGQTSSQGEQYVPMNPAVAATPSNAVTPSNAATPNDMGVTQ